MRVCFFSYCRLFFLRIITIFWLNIWQFCSFSFISNFCWLSTSKYIYSIICIAPPGYSRLFVPRGSKDLAGWIQDHAKTSIIYMLTYLALTMKKKNFWKSSCRKHSQGWISVYKFVIKPSAFTIFQEYQLILKSGKTTKLDRGRWLH